MYIRRQCEFLDMQVPGCANDSGMFVSNDIPSLEAIFRKSISLFTTRLSSSTNKLICAIEQFWIMKSLIWKTWEEKMYI